MLGDIKPTLSLSFPPSQVNQRPELKLTVDYKDEKVKFIVSNISKHNAYQIYIFAREDHYTESSIELVAQAGDVLAPSESSSTDSYTQIPFIGCMSYTEYWVEFSSADGKHYRYATGSDNSGISLSSLKEIKKRTQIRGKKIMKKSKLKICISNIVYKVRFKMKI